MQQNEDNCLAELTCVFVNRGEIWAQAPAHSSESDEVRSHEMEDLDEVQPGNENADRMESNDDELDEVAPTPARYE